MEAAPRARRRLWPWLAAAALLAWLVWRLPLDEVRRALAAGPWPALALYTLPLAALTLVADAWATRAGLAAAGVRLPAGELLLVRGASYLLGLVSYTAGQGGIGVYLHLRGLAAPRAAGCVLFLLGCNLTALVAAAAAGRSAGGPAPAGLRGVDAALLAAGGALLVYYAIVAARPRRLAERPGLAPLFSAGLRGHLIATAARLPHVAALALGQWGALWIWGVRMPLAQGLALLPLVLFVAALPITPAGLGTVQAAQVVLLSSFAPGATAAAREAAVLAFGLAFAALGLAFQAATGALCLALLARRRRAAGAA